MFVFVLFKLLIPVGLGGSSPFLPLPMILCEVVVCDCWCLLLGEPVTPLVLFWFFSCWLFMLLGSYSFVVFGSVLCSLSRSGGWFASASDSSPEVGGRAKEGRLSANNTAAELAESSEGDADTSTQAATSSTTAPTVMTGRWDSQTKPQTSQCSNVHATNDNLSCPSPHPPNALFILPHPFLLINFLDMLRY